MLKKTLAAVLTLLILTAYSLAVSAHEEHKPDGEAKHQHHDHSGMCEGFFTKAGSTMPDFGRPHWVKIKNVDQRPFFFTFYYDTTRPAIRVAAMTVQVTTHAISPSGQSVVHTQTRWSWQENEEIRTVRIEENEMVCTKLILTQDHKKYDLGELMDRIEKKLDPA